MGRRPERAGVSRQGLLVIVATIAALTGPVDAVEADELAPPAVAAGDQAADRFDIGEFRVLGNTKLDARIVEAAVYPFLGPGRTLHTVEDARDALVAAYRAAGLGTVLVDIPEQAVDEGIVRLQVTEGRIETVRIAGARYYSERKILARLPAVKAGEVPSLPALQAELGELAAESRDREITPVLKPGSEPGTLAVGLDVKDSLPLHASIESNNRYSADTTLTRLVATLSYENMFQRAETLSLQYQTAPQKPSEVEVAAATYSGRTAVEGLGWSAYAIRSKSDVAAIGTLSVLGNGTIVGGRLNAVLAAGSGSVQSLSAGADYKSFSQNVNLPGSVTDRTPIHYVIWTLQYSAARQGAHLDGQGSLGLSFAMRGLGTSDTDFEFNRSGAHAGFAYLRGNGSANWHLWHDLTVGLRFAGQYTEQPLVTNEQFALGGVDTVRGYLEAEALVDSGAAASLEIRTPQMRAGRFAGRLLAFYDRGVGLMQQPLGSEIASGSVRTDLASFGAGVRFNVDPNIDAIVNWAHPVRAGTHTPVGDSRVEFSLKLSY